MSKSRGIYSTGEFLSQIDPNLTQYSAVLVNKGFGNTRTLAHLTLSDIPEIPLGLRRLLIHETSKLRSPLNRQLLEDKDSATVSMFGNPPTDSPIVINDDINTRSTLLKPKQLFPLGTASSVHYDNRATSGQLSFGSYEYRSPMEKHLSKILTEISEKDIEIEKTKSEIEALKPVDESLADNVGITCGRCHQGNHTKRRCVDPPCTTSISCGKIRFHKSEMKVVDNKKGHLKKLIRDKVSLESECKKIRETIAATVKTFPQAIRSALINSNKKEYLTIHEGKFVPLTTRINRDITILQKYYGGKIPSDIDQESSLFPAIIAEANKTIQVDRFTIEQKLEESLAAVQRRITGAAPQNTPEPSYITLDSSPETMSPRYTAALATPNCSQQPPQVPVRNASITSVTTHSLSTPTPPQLPHPQPNSLFSSPPSKVSKQGTNTGYKHELGNIVTTFSKLNSPSKIPDSQSTTCSDSNNITDHTTSLTTKTCTNTGTKPDSILTVKESRHVPQDTFKSPDLHATHTKESDNCTNSTTSQIRTPPQYYPYFYPNFNHGLVHTPYQCMAPPVNLFMQQQFPKTSPPIANTDSHPVEANNFAQFNQKPSARTYTPSGALCKIEPNSDSFFPYPFDTKNPPPYYNFGMPLPNAPFPYPFIPNITCKTEPVAVPEAELSTHSSPPPSKLQLGEQNGPKSVMCPSSDIHVQPQETTDSSENIDVVDIVPKQTTSANCSNNDYVAKFDLESPNEVRLKTGSVSANSISQAETSTCRPSSV